MKSSRSQTIGTGCSRWLESKVSLTNTIFLLPIKFSIATPTATLHLRSKEINLNAILGVVHLGQIQSGLRAAIRIVQGSHIKIHMNSDVPVQVTHYFIR